MSVGVRVFSGSLHGGGGFQGSNRFKAMRLVKSLENNRSIIVSSGVYKLGADD